MRRHGGGSYLSPLASKKIGMGARAVTQARSSALLVCCTGSEIEISSCLRDERESTGTLHGKW